MGQEYKIEWKMPGGYDPSNLLNKLSSPIGKGMAEIYNYSVETDGFYFLDNLVDQKVAGAAFKRFVDEALGYEGVVTIADFFNTSLDELEGKATRCRHPDEDVPDDSDPQIQTECVGAPSLQRE